MCDDIKTEQELDTFKQINSMANKGGIVFMGSDYFASLPLCELASVFNLRENIYNRSLPGATVKSMSEKLDDCVINLSPDKIFVNLGDVEARDPLLDLSEFISSYEWLLYTLNGAGIKIYVVSLTSENENAKKINASLIKLCADLGCKFVDITSVIGQKKSALHVFDTLKYYMHTCALDFAEIISMR